MRFDAWLNVACVLAITASTAFAQATRPAGARDLRRDARIVAAALAGDTAEVRALLAAGVNPESRGATNTANPTYCPGTALHVAAAAGNEPLARLLMASGANVNVTDACQTTPLAYAVRHTGMVRLLIAQGATVSVRAHVTPCERGTCWSTLLHQAMTRPELYYGSVNQPPWNLVAVLRRQAQADSVLMLLLDNGADPNLPGSQGHTPLHGAMSIGDVNSVRLLLARGAQVNRREDVWGLTPLNPELRRTGGTIVQSAYREPLYLQAIQALIEAGADLNSRSDNCLLGPLHKFAKWADTGAVRLMLLAGADPNLRGGMNVTPLHAAFRSCIGSPRYDGYSWESIGWASGDTLVVRLLLEHGADVNATTADGTTPLQLAQGLLEWYDRDSFTRPRVAALSSLIEFMRSRGARE